MLEVVSIILSALAIVVAGAAWFRAGTPINETRDRSLESVDSPSLVAPSKLAGLTFRLTISQDHPYPIFARLLKDELEKADAGVVESDADSDIRIEGSIHCNGYSDIYFQAELTASNAEGPFSVIIEKPPHGDRPENLAREIVSRIESDWTKREDRRERGSAIRELRN
ncbi:MAG TPA: hypothetical protein VJ835_09530 [Fimbriimonadaceae bacterium]|nr:hypothetical protein [Fimbriimonadaceae bacterium]